MPSAIRVAVTGSRGKSGVVRLIHAALCGCGQRAYGRITGVVPRELSPESERPILRPSGANISEMKWWLRSLPASAEAVVLENSAVSPELQSLCALWLNPTVTVLTNIRPDHRAFWGPDEINVLHALSPALPQGGAVAMPEELTAQPAMQALAEKKNLTLLPAQRMPGFPPHLSANIGLALAVCRFCGLNEAVSLKAMENLVPDCADFCVLNIGRGMLAFAFSANDIVTTEELFQSTGWQREETGILFNHRADRADRFRCFESWMREYPWREVLIIGDRPPRSVLRGNFWRCGNVHELGRRLSGARWMGCGNTVYGLPLTLKLTCEEGGLCL